MVIYSTYYASAEVGDRNTANWHIQEVVTCFLWWKWTSYAWQVRYFHDGSLESYAQFNGNKPTREAALKAVSYLIEGRE